MDRRQLFFLVSMFFALFVVNMFFTYQEQNRNKQWYEQQQARKEQQQRELDQDVARRTAEVTDLPVLALFSDSQGRSYLSSALGNEEAIVVLAWSNVLPDTVYGRTLGTKHALKAYKRSEQNVESGQPVIYTTTPSAKLNIAPLPEIGQFDLQLLTAIPRETDEQVATHLANYRNGEFTLPAEELTVTESRALELLPQRDSLVARRIGKSYYPVGTYSIQARTFKPLKEYTAINESLTAVAPAPTSSSNEADREQYYVLENEYQQLVFSSIGGALVEVNLPLQSDSNEKTLVKSIEVDRDITEYHKANARFPSKSYYIAGENPSNGFEKVEEPQIGGYYPLLRRGLFNAEGEPKTQVLPHYYLANIVGEYPEIARSVYEVTYFDNEKIVFETQQSRRRITKTYTLGSTSTGAPYVIDLQIDIDGDARGLWISSGLPEVEFVSGAPVPSVKYRLTRNGSNEVVNVDLPRDTSMVSSFHPDWVSNANGFFGVIMDPVTSIDAGYKVGYVSGQAVPSRMVLLQSAQQQAKEKDLPAYQVLLPLKESGGSQHFRFFAGPYSGEALDAADRAYTNPITGDSPDYAASQSFHGWFSMISEPFARFLFVLMNFFHYLTGSWAFSIILLTIALRLMLYPLNAWSFKSTARMQQIAPEVQRLQEKYKKDPKRAQMEVMNLYRERGVNPLSGCFPLLIQMPFLIGMFDLLKSTFELRGATFIPGWIDNLTSPDVLFTWGYSLPFIGNEFHLLPILLGICMFVQQRMMAPASADPSQMTDQQRQQRAMTTMMAPVFTILFYNFPSGLNLYWISSTLVGMLQQWYTQKNLTPAEPVKTKSDKTSKNSKPKKLKA